NPVILLAHPPNGDYNPLELDSTTIVNVSGVVPSSGLVYVTIHLDYGLKKSGGFTKDALTNAAKHPAFALADSALTITDPQVYNQFSFSDGTTSGMDTPSSTNTFKKNPGFAHMTLQNLSGTPKANVKVQVFSPTGKLLSTTFTDQDGFSMFAYKHTGKQADYIVKLPDYNQQKVVTMKSNGFAIVVFDAVPYPHPRARLLEPGPGWALDCACLRAMEVAPPSPGMLFPRGTECSGGFFWLCPFF